MSLSWRDRLLISISPSEICWLRRSGLLKKTVIAKGMVPVDRDYGTHPWDGAIAALRNAATVWSRERLSVRVVLSNHLVRYALVPVSDQVSGHAEELALARFHFNKVHGESSRGWDIRLSPGRSGAPRLASAIDTALLQALRQIFGANQRPRLDSVQPLLMSVFNQGGSAIPGNGAWLIMTEPDRSCIALVKGKTWHAVQNVKGHFPDVDSWIALAERERWRVDLDGVPDTLLIHGTQSSTLPLRTHGAWKVAGLQARWPAGLSPSQDGAYIRALSAA